MIELSINELEKGVIFCIENAKELICSAKNIKESTYKSSSYGLFQLAIEESSKAKILLRIIVEKKSEMILLDKERDKYFKEMFVDHSMKIKLGAFSDENYNTVLGELGLPFNRDTDEIEKEISHPKSLDNLKQNSFYVFLENNKFKKPSNKVSLKMIKKIELIAESRVFRIEDTFKFYKENADFFIEQFKKNFLYKS